MDYAASRRCPMLRLVESPPGGIEGGPHATVPLGGIAPFRLEEVQALPGLGQDVAQGEDIRPRGSQFRGRRQAVHLAADIQQDRQVLRSKGDAGLDATCALDQQLKGRMGSHVCPRKTSVGASFQPENQCDSPQAYLRR
jgi:hypothetical protein